MRRCPKTLREQIAPIRREQRLLFNKAIAGMEKIEAEAERVADLMRNATNVLDDLDREFEERCKLTKTDAAFLLIAAALQCLRQYIFTNDAFRLTSQEGDKLAKKFVPKNWRDILTGSVPYDAIRTADDFVESTGLSGTTHRYRTLGHDPLWGWLFGPVNIITDSLTKTNFATTYYVENMRICGYYPASTIGALKSCMVAVQTKKMLLPVSVLRQAIHFGSDYFTKHGLPVPIISSLNENFAKSLLTQYNIDMYSTTRGITLSVLLNTIISYIHSLFYDPDTDHSYEMYKVRTRRIITYSNIISSSSNIVAVAIQSMCGNTNSLKMLDIGGLIVTLYRLFTERRYVFQLKEEFLSRCFFDIAMNNDKKEE